MSSTSAPDLICFSHLRWDFIMRRPQHLMTRWARDRRVWFFEQPDPRPSHTAYLDVRRSDSHVQVVTPHLPAGADANKALRLLLTAMMAQQDIRDYIAWYYSPAAMSFTDHLRPLATVYDCMEEVPVMRNGHLEAAHELEATLCRKADLVFTGGHGLYEEKRHLYPSVHAFPSAVDFPHFVQARMRSDDPPDQYDIPHPRLGWFGVIDERVDLDLISGLAWRRPDWHIVLVGPIANISPAALPQAPNIHYLGNKPYSVLPRYLAGWDVAIMPFVRNESTRFLSPSKTPEYLAGGRPIVSTSLRDVMRPYGALGLVEIADTPKEFEEATKRLLASDAKPRWQSSDAFLEKVSWESTWRAMKVLVDEVIAENPARARPELSNPGIFLPGGASIPASASAYLRRPASGGATVAARFPSRSTSNPT
jgi:UDP-galactopyranose mutase